MGVIPLSIIHTIVPSRVKEFTRDFFQKTKIRYSDVSVMLVDETHQKFTRVPKKLQVAYTILNSVVINELYYSEKLKIYINVRNEMYSHGYVNRSWIQTVVVIDNIIKALDKKSVKKGVSEEHIDFFRRVLESFRYDFVTLNFFRILPALGSFAKEIDEPITYMEMSFLANAYEYAKEFLFRERSSMLSAILDAYLAIETQDISIFNTTEAEVLRNNLVHYLE